MKRAEIVGAGKPLDIVTKEIPDPPPSGLILKTSYAGVCHSDLHFLKDEKDLGMFLLLYTSKFSTTTK